jgi:hypothetical protein
VGERPRFVGFDKSKSTFAGIGGSMNRENIDRLPLYTEMQAL